jgi:hypothetical protein
MKTGDIGRAKCCALHRHALFPGVHIAHDVVLPRIGGIVERAAERVNIFCDRASEGEGCCGYTVVEEIIWRSSAGHTIPMDFSLPPIMLGDF